MTKKMKAACVGAVALVAISYYVNSSSNDYGPGKKAFTRAEMQIRSADYIAKSQAAAAAKAAGLPPPVSAPPQTTPPEAKVESAKMDPPSDVAWKAPADPASAATTTTRAAASAAPAATSNLRDLAQAELNSGITNSIAPPVETVTVTDTRQSFHAGPRSLYLRVSGGAVVWVKLSSRLAVADADSISESLKGACFGLSPMAAPEAGKACNAQVEVDAALFEHVKQCSSLGSDAEAQMLGQNKLENKYYLFCPTEGNCWSEPNAKLNLIAKAPLEAGEAVGEVEGLILPSGGCVKKGTRIPASTADLVIEKIMQTSRATPL